MSQTLSAASNAIERGERAPIHLMAFALSLSLMTIALAILDFIFAHGGDGAWRSLLAVGGFWIAGPLALYVSSRMEKRVKRDKEKIS